MFIIIIIIIILRVIFFCFSFLIATVCRILGSKFDKKNLDFFCLLTKSIAVFHLEGFYIVLVLFYCCYYENSVFIINSVVSLDLSAPLEIREMGKPTARCMKRLMSELKALQEDPPANFSAGPDPKDILKWCFVLDGAPSSPFEGGRYVGQINFDVDFPMKPPTILFLTPNGRFSTGVAICLSNTSFHPEQWSPIWGIRTIITGLIAFMNVEEHGVGALHESEERRRYLAGASAEFNVTHLRHIYRTALPDVFDRDLQMVEEAKSKPSSGLKAGESTSGGSANDVSRDSFIPLLIGSILFLVAVVTLYKW